MSRRGITDPEFSSDSFLDIIANIVGILIILVVIAGVKVARQPAAASAVNIGVDPMNQSVDADTQESGCGTGVTAMRTPVALRLIDAESVVSDLSRWLRRESARALGLQEEARQLGAVRQELLVEGEALKIELSGLRLTAGQQQADQEQFGRRLRAAADAAQSMEARTAELQAEIGQAARDSRLLSQAVRTMEERQSTAIEHLHTVERETQKLTEILEREQDKVIVEGETLQHRLSPVARPTSNQELHFRLKDGRIAWVPLEALLEQLKRQISGRAGLIRRFGRYEGVVGPIGGFRMVYRVERQLLPPLQVLNSGGSGFRVAVSRWTVEPTDTLVSESAAKALQSGSRFRQVAEAAELDATITIWLYPDNFGYFRNLREFAHGLGLRVAARPLPEGVSITGSPGGSRSSAQ